MNHTKLFKILFIEDIPLDVDIAVRELRKANFLFEYSTVCTKIDLQNSLRDFNPDLIISDYVMPSFNGLQALKIAREYNEDLPFILCTGSVNEEVAIDCIKAGAMDYVTKQHMTRLPFAVKDALDKVRISKEKKAYDLLLKENEAKLQSIFSASQIGIGLVVNRILIEVNDFFCTMMEYERRELIGKSSEILYPSNHEYVSAGYEKYKQISEKGTGSVETIFKKKNGKLINVIVSSAPLDINDHSRGVSFTVLDITDRKKAVDELVESHRSINTLISNIQGLVYRCRNDKHYTALFLSEGVRELTGYIPEDFLENKNISFKDIIYKDDQDYVWTEIQKALKSREHWEITYRIITKSGEIRWVWEKGEGIFLPKGDLQFLEGFITDITQRKKNDEALKESRQLFETLAKTSPVGIFRTKLDGFTTYVNPKWQDLSGLTFEQSLGFNWLNAVHPDDRKSLEQKWKSDLSMLKESIGEYRFMKPDGKISWVMGSAVPEKIENEVVGYIGTVTDITAHHITEESLRKSEEKYRRIFENVQDVYYETTIDGVIIEVSPSIEILSRHEYHVEDLIGRSMDDFYSDPKERQLITDELKEKGHVTDFEVTLRNKNGLKYPC
jgi:PAS domain S-box-containing protein